MEFVLFDEHPGIVHPVGTLREAKPGLTVRALICARVGQGG